MFSKSVSANIISLLLLLRILPSGRSKVMDIVGFILWMLVFVGWSAVFVCFDLSLESWAVPKSIPGAFRFLSNLVIPSTQVLLTIPALSYLCHNKPCLVQDRKLPNPQRLVMFLIGLGLYFLYYTISAIKFFDEPIQEWNALKGITFLHFGLWALANVLTCFVIGTSMKQVCRKISDTDKCSTDLIEEISADLHMLKKGLSPVLFMMFSTKCILLVNAALILATKTINHKPIWMSILAVTLWDLAYVTLVVDDTLAAFKGLTSRLR